MKTRWLVGWLVLLLTFLTIGASAGASTDQNLVKVRFQSNWIAKEEHAWLYGAHKAGIFRKHGIDLQIQQGRGSVLALQVLGGGGADMAFSNSLAFAQAVERGLRVIAVAGTTQRDPSLIASWPGSPVRTVKDLEGKTLQVTLGSGFTLTVQEWLRRNGADPSKVKINQVDAAAAGPLFASHKADAMSWFRTVSLAPLEQQAGVKFVRLMSEKWIGGKATPNEVVVVQPEYLSENRNTVKKMVAAVSDALRWANGNPGKAAEAVAPLLGNPPLAQVTPLVRVQSNMAHTPGSKGKPFGWMAKADWAETLAWAKFAWLLKADTKVFWTNGFIPVPKKTKK